MLYTKTVKIGQFSELFKENYSGGWAFLRHAVYSWILAKQTTISPQTNRQTDRQTNKHKQCTI